MFKNHIFYFYLTAGQVCLSFYYSMYGSDMGRLQIFTNQRDTNIIPSNPLFDVSGDQGNTYKYQSVTLNAGDYPDPVVCCCFFRLFFFGYHIILYCLTHLLDPQVSKT